MELMDLVKNGSFLEIEVKNTDELFERLYEELYAKNLVNDEFLNAIKKREEEFPTGIQLDSMSIALPHIDAQYVKTNALVIRKMKNPILFRRMDNFDENLSVNIVFLLLINDVKSHMQTISSLTKIWTNSNLMNEIMKIDSHEALIALLESNGI